ncbi:hypothetical protein G4B88_029377 [Cannabis sativa]|uniref:Uncharacterized protein n=1 Tax=Cannabis sativa TaxID=3483 RepID=A0A7J6FZ52_CANSA|nr:hypothetical protein G4B88_029377 [Cannabis sativa]
MKNKASIVLKQIISLLSSLGSKAKSRTNAAKARLIMFSLMKNKKVLMESLSHKIHNLLGNNNHNKEGDDDDDVMEEDLNKAIVLYNANAKANGMQKRKKEVSLSSWKMRLTMLQTCSSQGFISKYACLPVFHLEKFPLQDNSSTDLFCE